MGLFLQTAIIPDCEVWEVQEAVKNVEEWLDTLDSAQCSYRRLEHGCMVLFNEDCFGCEELAVELSSNLSSPVLLLYIYDGDFWGYYFYEKGVELDQFSPMPDYFEDCSPQEQQRCAGNSALLARYFSVEQESIERYLRQCDCWHFCISLIPTVTGCRKKRMPTWRSCAGSGSPSGMTVESAGMDSRRTFWSF